MNRIRILRNVSHGGIAAATALSLALTLPTAHAARPSLAGLQAEIASLNARPAPVLVVANDVVIGTLVHPNELGEETFLDCRYQTLSSKNYIFEVTYSCLNLPGQIAGQLGSERLAYESVNCTGQAYLWYEPVRRFGAANLSQGKVFAAADGMRYYVPLDTEPVVISVRSMKQPPPYSTNPGCVPFGGGSFYTGQPAFLNDPDVTGVENTTFSAPIQLAQ